jgi:hypothetical protein
MTILGVTNIWHSVVLRVALPLVKSILINGSCASWG